jgi:CysZ protein
VTLLADLRRALAQFDDPRFLRAIGKGLAATLAALVALSAGLVAFVGWMVPGTVTLPWIGEIGFVGTAAAWAAAGAMVLVSMALAIPAAAVAVGFFLDDVAEAVEARHYPHLPPARPLSLAAQVAEGLRFLLLILAANLLAFGAYLALPPLAPFLFWGVNGYLLGREYFHLVASRRLDREAAQALRRRHRLRVWLAGVALAAPMTVPVVNLAAPVLGAAVFAHQVQRLTGAAEG